MNVIQFPSSKIVRLPEEETLAYAEIRRLERIADEVSDRIMVSITEVLSDHDLTFFNDNDFLRDMKFLEQSVKSMVYRTLDLEHPMQELVDQTTTIMSESEFEEYMSTQEKQENTKKEAEE